MQEHAMFASGKFDSINGKQKYLQMWSELASELNNLGPEKSVVQYQAVTLIIYFKNVLQQYSHTFYIQRLYYVLKNFN